MSRATMKCSQRTPKSFSLQSRNTIVKKKDNINFTGKYSTVLGLQLLNKYITASILMESEPMTFCGQVIRLKLLYTFPAPKSKQLFPFFFFFLFLSCGALFIQLIPYHTDETGNHSRWSPRHNSNRFFVQTKDKEGYSNDLLISEVEN